MRVMYWNCTAPGVSGNSFVQAKLAVIGGIVQNVQPDILCLDEVSASVSDTTSANHFATNVLNGAVTYGSPKVSVNPGVHLNSVTYTDDNVGGINTQVGLPNNNWNSTKTKRDLTRCKFIDKNKTVLVWFLHANASSSGGKTASGLASDDVANKTEVYIGDFNCPIGQVPGTTAPPAVGAYTNQFTQWKVDDYGHAVVPGTSPPRKYEPHSVIDYAVYDGGKLTVAAVDTLAGLSNDDLRKVFLNFDHFPVAYDVTAL